MRNEANNSERNIEEVIKEYDELVQRSDGIDPSWKDEEVNALKRRWMRRCMRCGMMRRWIAFITMAFLGSVPTTR